MKDEPEVSVIVPTYRHADYVLATLDSVDRQTFTNLEIIVINDGSPDATAERLRPLAAAGRIAYHEQTNAGQAAARNRGLSLARGEFIAFLDDDDLWPPDKLAWQVDALQAHPDWVMVSGLCGHLAADGSHVEPADASGEIQLQPIEAMFAGSTITSPGQVLIRRAALEAVGGFDVNLWGTDDTDLWMRLAATGTAAQVRRTALYYRVHASNASHAAARMFWNSMRMVRKNLRLVPAALRAKARRDALRLAYVYCGRRLVAQALASGGASARWDALCVLAYLAPAMFRDRELASLVGSDILPAGVQRLWRATRPLPSR
jgi:glycosyltransferase involved in cell wall biosynthesis